MRLGNATTALYSELKKIPDFDSVYESGDGQISFQVGNGHYTIAMSSSEEEGGLTNDSTIIVDSVMVTGEGDTKIDDLITEFWDGQIFNSEKDIQSAGKEFEDKFYAAEDTVADTELQEGDITTGDYHIFYQYGKKWAEFPQDMDWDEIKAEIEAQMEEDKFYPNVWFVSDHGNPHLIDDIYNGR